MIIMDKFIKKCKPCNSIDVKMIYKKSCCPKIYLLCGCSSERGFAILAHHIKNDPLYSAYILQEIIDWNTIIHAY